MEDTPQNMQNINVPKKSSIALYILLAVILAVAIIALYMYSNGIDFMGGSSRENTLSEEQKLNILDTVSDGSESATSIDERKNLVEKISNNQTSDSKKLSDNEKLNILRSLEQ